MKMKNQEAKLLPEMKRCARNNEIKSVRIMAKDLIRMRSFQDRFLELQAQLKAISLQMQTMASTQAFTEGMRNATLAMKKMNAKMKIPALQQIMLEFQKQNEMMNLKQEILADTLEDTVDEDAEEDVDELVNQILDEVGISIAEQLPEVGSNRLQVGAVADTASNDVLNVRRG
uniref:Charged multivesicular body protein 2a n=1 Tax=Lygus hesperus TaxID=30085 RepID=A0A0A9VWZ6_LYGHE